VWRKVLHLLVEIRCHKVLEECDARLQLVQPERLASNGVLPDLRCAANNHSGAQSKNKTKTRHAPPHHMGITPISGLVLRLTLDKIEPHVVEEQPQVPGHVAQDVIPFASAVASSIARGAKAGKKGTDVVGLCVRKHALHVPLALGKT
jgi:hypothetical protein